MPDVAFPLSSTPGQLTGEGEGRLVNVYPEKAGDTVYWRRLPGIATFATSILTAPRGMLEVNGQVYIAFSGQDLIVFEDGSVQYPGGTLPGTDGVTLARNNRVTDGVSTPDVVAVRSTGGAYTLTAGVGSYPDADLPANVNSVSRLGPFFVFTIADGRIFASELNSTAINSLSFATAESSPDGLVRGFTHANRFYACGERSIEVWSNQGLAPFPLGRFPTTIPVGLLAPMAVAGFEEGWDRSPLFVAHDGTVRELTGGFEAKVVSTPDVEAFIAASDRTTLEAMVYTFRGRAVWTLSSDLGSWGFDVTQRSWHERESAGLGRWRASRSVKAFDRWLVCDTQSGWVGEILDDVRTEYGDPLVWKPESAPFRQFPSRVAIPAVFLHFTAAAANVGVSWSLDGGGTWIGPYTYSLADADVNPIRVSRLGLSTQHGLRLRLTVSDDVAFSFMGASVQAAPMPQPAQVRAA